MFIVDKDGWLVSDQAPIARKLTPNIGGKLTPEGVIIHYTASSNARGSVDWLCNPAAKASAHLVIGQTGKVTQLAPFNRVTWHAGQSEYKGRAGCNSFTIGIELANAGPLHKKSDGSFVDSYKSVHQTAFEHKSMFNPSVTEYWDDYTADQVRVNQLVCVALAKKYRINFIAGHMDIAPSRKVDPGPAFPMAQLQNSVLGVRK